MSQQIIGAPTPPGRLLDSARRVRLELTKIYKDMRLGTIKTADGTRMAYVLQVILRCIETDDVERRLAELEERFYADKH